MGNFKSNTIDLIKRNVRTSNGIACVTICHNECMIINQFLDHYRSIGVDIFYVVDDHSNDGTREILKSMDDVVLFYPKETSSFRADLAVWRQDILDNFLDGQWATLPDIDEFLYYLQMPRSLRDVCEELESRGEEVLLGVMIDMYQDRPILENKYSGKKSLLDEFPLFDGQGLAPAGIRILSQKRDFRKEFPTPEVSIRGGVRDRLFFQYREPSKLQRWLLTRFAHSRRPFNPNWIQRIQSELVRRATKTMYPTMPPVLNKFSLIKWRKGLRFHRAPHFVSEKMKVSEGLSALLHFKFYKGWDMVDYTIKRGQHLGGGFFYKKILESIDFARKSPVHSSTRRFKGVDSLRDIIR